MDILLYALAVAAGLWLLVALSGFLPTLLLRFVSFAPLDDGEAILRRAGDAVGVDWLAAEGFLPDGAVRPLGIPVALFRQEHGPTAMAVYFANDRPVVDFVTEFPNHVGLTTASTADGVTAPLPPGSVMQCLPAYGLAQRWAAHARGVALLRDRLGVDPVPMPTVPQAMGRAVRRQVDGMIGRPWLILAIPWRYFVTRFRYRNIELATQLERGWIDLEQLRTRAQGLP